jgi:hypothetical protein
MVIQLVTKVTHAPGAIVMVIPLQAEPAVVRFFETLHGAPATVLLKKFYQRRTTGWKSQSHHINGHCQQIAEATGNDFDAIKTYCKTQAISRGYPFDTIKGQVVPWSETRIDVLQASILIDEIHHIAADEGILLRGD